MTKPLMRGDLARSAESAGGDSTVVDVILSRMVTRQISARMISSATGIRRSRAHNILHRDPEKRHPIRVDEKAAILDFLGISVLEAALATNIMCAPQRHEAGATQIATMLSILLHSLPTDIAEMVEHIEGIDFNDIRPEHGLRLRELLLGFLQKHYRDIGDRRLRRTRDLDAL